MPPGSRSALYQSTSGAVRQVLGFRQRSLQPPVALRIVRDRKARMRSRSRRADARGATLGRTLALMGKTLTQGSTGGEWTGAKNDPPGREPPGREPPGKDRGNEDGRTSIATKTRPKTKKPSLYKVLLLNDDYTPMEFVVLVLEKYFAKGRDEATRIMLHVHHKGVGICGVYPYEVAETKVTQVMDFSRQNGHPLQCTMEKE